MSHLLTDGQTKQRDKIAKQMLKILLNFDEKKFTNVVTGGETWVHYSEPVRKVSNKICAIIFYHFFRNFFSSKTTEVYREQVSCSLNSFHSFWPILLKLYRCFKDGLKICMCFFRILKLFFITFYTF